MTHAKEREKEKICMYILLQQLLFRK